MVSELYRGFMDVLKITLDILKEVLQ